MQKFTNRVAWPHLMISLNRHEYATFYTPRVANRTSAQGEDSGEILMTTSYGRNKYVFLFHLYVFVAQ